MWPGGWRGGSGIFKVRKIRRMTAAFPPLFAPQGDDYYRYHIFFCLNERANGQDCCARHGAVQGFDYCKQQVKAAGLAGKGQVRVNKAGCLDRCAAAPVCVVYPEGVWYTFVDEADIDEIITSHFQQGRIVQRLLIAPDIGR